MSMFVYVVAFCSADEMEIYDEAFVNLDNAREFAEGEARKKGFAMDECCWMNYNAEGMSIFFNYEHEDDTRKHMMIRSAFVKYDTCSYIYSFAANGWADHTCDKCGYTENLDVQCTTGFTYCPGCGRKIVKDSCLKFDTEHGTMGVADVIFGETETAMVDYSWKNGKPIYVIELLDDYNKSLYPNCFSSLEDAKEYAVKKFEADASFEGDMAWRDDVEAEIYIYGRTGGDYYNYDMMRVSALYLDPQ